MTIFNTARLPQASWKGALFHYKESTISGGRKTITHEYPDTDVRYVEDLGGLEKTYNIEAVINTNVSFVLRDDLIKKLEEGGIGILIHPAFGNKKVVLKTYSISDNTSSLGICSFSLVFEEASLNRMPESVVGNKGFIDRLKSGTFNLGEEVFGSKWQSIKNAKDAADSGVATLSNTANEMRRVAQLVQGSADTFSDFTTSINELVDGSRALVQTPDILSKKITTAFNNLSVAYDRSEDLFFVLKNFFGYNGADRFAIGTSATQRLIANNQNQIQNIFQVAALASAYDAAANIDYITLDQLSLIISDLEDGFDLLPSSIDRTLYKSMLQMRIEIMNIFNNLSISLPKVTKYKTQKTSLNALVYSLYGSLEKKNQIRDLNSFIDTSAVEGEINILSNA